MKADKPSDQPAEAGRAAMALTAYRPAPFDGTGIGDVHEFAWDGDGIRATGEITRRAHGLVITRLEVLAGDDAHAGLTHQLLRQIPLGEILAEARTYRPELEASYLRMQDGPSAATLPPGRVPITDDLLRQVALVYLEESGPGKGRAALQRLAERFGRPVGTVRTWLGRAREEGWLGPGVQGRLGADPGPRLLDEWARMPMVTETGPNQVTVRIPPKANAETAEEGRARTLKFLDDRGDRAGCPPVDPAANDPSA
ncbi:hypothetical protein [Streptomyces lavendulae]|uniref:hypothetical protein n=1 Tax=Streptomyces lavendulae TaxID=1914 RepID=UPI0036EDC827